MKYSLCILLCIGTLAISGCGSGLFGDEKEKPAPAPAAKPAPVSDTVTSAPTTPMDIEELAPPTE